MIGYLAQNHPLVAAFRSLPKTRTRPAARLAQRIFKTAPKLSDYFREGEYLSHKGDLDRPISGLALDSRRVQPGNVFFAVPGRRTDGQAYIAEAIQRGAVAIVGGKMPAGTALCVTYLQVADVRRSLAQVAQRYFGFPDKSLDIVAVSGRHGKTTVASLVQHLLAGSAQRVGLIGSVHYDLGVRTVPAYRTTPESLDLHGLLAQMRDAGCRQAVLEVSAPGLEQQRVCGVNFGVATFTGFTGVSAEGMEASFAAQAGLLDGGAGQSARAAVINLDDGHGGAFAAWLGRRMPSSFKLVTYGEAAGATIRAEQVRLNASSTALRLCWPGGTLELETPLLGRYNVSNLLAAFATCHALGRDLSVIAARLKSFGGVAGRLEPVTCGQPCRVFVDYAHTADTLRHTLGELRALTPGRLLVVFGCGGRRDRTQRPVMTGVVQEFADLAWATADNPRAEKPGQIFADMQPGVQRAGTMTFVADRRSAIGLALAAAREGDCVLIAGKGHETTQELADTIIPFDDRQVVRALLGSLCHQPA